ncbi:DUF6036 family nucleotidyltransferase [Candidatus Nitronereus thalassa]|uniref:DUF6036 family nucleotidyltransferase n=1 Tax=Candidatus Nitronereus thalassa TaxID=3020898 RepID=A0ABU3KD35_9BACT|nr:DUF6036 family nucleotidyltransferase [Candidatus Nitronereus thalassa]MDT7044067.1 DUF6036 family nucleotidyltransferase [Candidatus Nitronereus thalassa]
MLPLNIDKIIQELTQYVRQTGTSVDLILVGELALQAYGLTDRVTMNVDGELVGQLNELVEFLQKRQVPADLGENMSGWSVVAMPPGYRDRTTTFCQDSGLTLRLLAPTDFVIAKLRCGTEIDLEDAEYVVKKFSLSSSDIQKAAESAIAASPKDTALFLFNKTIKVFCQRLETKP